MASGVLSLPVKPVPPVVSMVWMFSSAIHLETYYTVLLRQKIQ